MKKLLLILILILSFVGCKESDEELFGVDDTPKGTKFKIYTYEQKLDISRKVKSQERVPENPFPQDIYPETVEEYMNHQSIINSEARYGNKKAQHEREEWERASVEVGFVPMKR